MQIFVVGINTKTHTFHVKTCEALIKSHTIRQQHQYVCCHIFMRMFAPFLSMPFGVCSLSGYAFSGKFTKFNAKAGINIRVSGDGNGKRER